MTNVDKDGAPGHSLSRRNFLHGVGGATVATLAAQALNVRAATPAAAAAQAAPAPVLTPSQRRTAARQTRMDAAQMAYSRPVAAAVTNGEEGDYGGKRLGNFSKGLPHNSLGEVDLAAYTALLHALDTASNADFEAVPMGGVRRLTSPQAGMAFDLEGPDAQDLAIRPAPRIDSAEEAGEMAELYWMALARDVPFTDYAANSLTNAAATDLSRFSDFRGPKAQGVVTPATLFRGGTPGDLNGPYLSQFLLRDIPYGSLTINQRQQAPLAGRNYMTAYAEWLSVQNGNAPAETEAFDPTPRYMRNGRDIARYVHIDALYEAYLNACLALLGMGAPVDPGNPYVGARTQDGFATFGPPHVLSLVTEVATRALKAVWCCKWLVHRRLRPEAFGGLVHHRATRAAGYPIHRELLTSSVIPRLYSAYGTYLLPQAFPEGSPLHPSYGSGHATVAGACVTILKAWFDESFVIPDPVVAAADGLSLQPYSGAPLTVGGELNKVASNIASARNFGGIHWRTDFTEAVRLGEAVALGVLEEQKATYNERFNLTVTKFDGTTVTV